MHRQLKILAAERELTIEALMLQALTDLFAKHVRGLTALVASNVPGMGARVWLVRS
jgi:hypothetical protein